MTRTRGTSRSQGRGPARGIVLAWPEQNRLCGQMLGRVPGAAPVLTDGVVTLRAHQPEDADPITEPCNDPDSLRFTTVPRPYGWAEAQDFLDVVGRAWRETSPTSTRCWAISAPGPAGEPAFAGSIDYRPSGQGTAEVGYGLHPAFRGRGLASRALMLVLDHAFGEGTEVMHWRAVVGNWASRKTAWRCGFRVEGTVRGLCPQPGGPPQDGWIGSLLCGDARQPCEPWPEELY
jgi:RimJ/RimL family protein N-acetyltransferase